MRVVAADWVLPGDAPALRDHAIALGADGTIAEVAEASALVNQGAPVTRVSGLVMPGLVNAHTHLELSALAGKVTGSRGFVDWVDRLIGLRVEVTEDEEAEAVSRAVASLVSSATVAVGEVTNSLAAVHALARAGIGGAIFHEVFGWNRERIMTRVRALEAELTERVGSWPTTDLAYAPAPHTLYTTHPDAVRAAIALTRERRGLTSLHLAEHAAERAAVERGEGPVIEWLEARTKEPRSAIGWPKVPLFDHAANMGALTPHTLLVHLTVARPDELARVHASGASVVVCPRSNLHIEAKLPPLLAMREAGLRVALGTDSLASSPSLDVLGEAKALGERFPSVPAWELFRMATASGADALRRPDLGRIVKGARPGLFAVDGAIDASPESFLLAHLSAPRRALAPRKEAS